MSVLEKILAFNASRDPVLVKLKFARMRESPFAFFRGTDHLFAEAWPELAPPEPGPSILICGDLHLENFGAFRTDAGDWCFGINDFDEALVAPCGLDVVRCASSILLAAVDWKLSPVVAANLVLTFLDHYRSAILAALEPKPFGDLKPIDGSDPISKALGSHKPASKKQTIDVYTHRSRDGSLMIRRDKKRRPALSKSTTQAITADVQSYLDASDNLKPSTAVDVTRRIAGIGSLGVERYIALIDGNEDHDGERLMDLKLATPSSLIACTDAKQPAYGGNEAKRIVAAQRQLQGSFAIGLDVVTIQEKAFRIREMIPDEDRCQIDRFRRKASKLENALMIIGEVVAWAHLRGAEFGSLKSRSKLGKWASGAALDAVLKSAVRFAHRTKSDFDNFKKEFPRRKKRR